MNLLEELFKHQTEKSNLRIWIGKCGTYIKSSGNGRKGVTEFFFPKKKT